MARLYVDEDLVNFVSPLREYGHDVASAKEADPGRTDAWHLRQASAEERVVLTFNERDNRYLHRLWTSLWVLGVMSVGHAGILSATAQLEPGNWLPALEQLLASETRLSGRMLVWYPAKSEWREDDWRPEE